MRDQSGTVIQPDRGQNRALVTREADRDTFFGQRMPERIVQRQSKAVSCLHLILCAQQAVDPDLVFTRVTDRKREILSVGMKIQTDACRAFRSVPVNAVLGCPYGHLFICTAVKAHSLCGFLNVQCPERDIPDFLQIQLFHGFLPSVYHCEFCYDSASQNALRGHESGGMRDGSCKTIAWKTHRPIRHGCKAATENRHPTRGRMPVKSECGNYCWLCASR